MKWCNRLIVGLISSIVIVLMVLFFVGDKQSFSENENRYLEKFPLFRFEHFFSGEYMDKLTTYVNDHFPFRNFFVYLQAKSEVLLGKKEISNVYLASDEYLLERYSSSVRINHVTSVLNEIYQEINYVNMSLMLVPSSISINEKKLPFGAITDNELSDINKIYYRLNFNSIPVYDALLEGNQYYPMYYRLDHHWTSYGAYYAYLEYCKKNDIHALDITKFEVKEISDSFRGTLDSKVHLYNYTPDKIHVFIPKNSKYEVNYVMSKRVTDTMYEEKHLHTKNKYSYFLDNNQPLIEITNLNSNTTNEIVVIKDSFANNFIPFLVEHYAKVHVIDPRYYKYSIPNYVKEHQNVHDVLFLYNMHNFANLFPYVG